MKKIAIIGTGISGLGAAYLLRNTHDITVYEKDATLGGHARTLNIDYDGHDIAVDTGFIVFNYRNYPHLTGMFKLLDVAVEKSDMSLGLSLEDTEFEWGCRNLSAVFAQKLNLLKPRFWKMLRDVLRFNKNALSHAEAHPKMTLGELLDTLNMSHDFKHRFLLPTAGAIWSSSPEQILDFPALTFAHFFENHGLLTVNDQPQWYTVSGGSKQYVEKISNHFKDAIKLNCAVTDITRSDGMVHITDSHGQKDTYDEVVIASHSDQALGMLSDATDEERAVLNAIPYQNNRAYLHSDPELMPKRKACWSSWNYLCDSTVDERARITVTYWMNMLQNIDYDKPLFVTLNPTTPPRKEHIFDEHIFEHPVYNMDMMNAQKNISSIQGKHGVWFCGAYQRYGFHEDGLLSAVNVAKKMGCSIPWE